MSAMLRLADACHRRYAGRRPSSNVHGPGGACLSISAAPSILSALASSLSSFPLL